jgi:hypothetical protein
VTSPQQQQAQLLRTMHTQLSGHTHALMNLQLAVNEIVRMLHDMELAQASMDDKLDAILERMGDGNAR